MAPTCRICGVYYPAPRRGVTSEERCKPCQAYFKSHGSTERPWFFGDTADAIARDLLPEFHSYTLANPHENPSVKPHQAGKRCQAGCGNLSASKRKASRCISCNRNQRMVNCHKSLSLLVNNNNQHASGRIHFAANLALDVAMVHGPRFS